MVYSHGLRALSTHLKSVSILGIWRQIEMYLKIVVALVQLHLLCFKHSHDAMEQFSSNKTVHLKRQRGNSVHVTEGCN